MRLVLIQLGVFLFIITNANALNRSAKSLDLLPIITEQPSSQLECEGNSVKFKVVASGFGLTYAWQRKSPTDLGFITVTDELNTIEGAITNELKILDVGSARFPNGTQFQVVVSDGSGYVISSIATLTVNGVNSVLPIATNVVQCFGTNYSYTVTTSYPENVVSYQWKKSVVSGVWDEINDGAIYSGTKTATLNITGGTPAESGNYRVYITFKSSGADCNVTSTGRNRRITFLPLLTTPVTTIIQPVCLVDTGTLIVTVQSATDVYSFDNGLTFQASNIKSGLLPGFYNVIIKNRANCVSAVLNCEIVGIGLAVIWNGLDWLNGTPDSARPVIFQGDFSSNSDLEVCNCQITDGANVVINSEHTLKVTNAVDVVSGSLTFENNASLVQVNDDAINSGSIIYKRNTLPVNRYDYTYWSSPVVGMTLGLPSVGLSPTTFFDKYFIYNNAWFSVPRSTVMIKGKGYSVRAPQTTAISGNPLRFLAVFEGVPHNGEFTLSGLARSQAHLLGNPYPSAIDADVFLNLNSDIAVAEELRVLEGTLYFWTHNTPPSTAIPGDKKYNYTTNDYATYNRTGGTGTTAKVHPLNYPAGVGSTNFSIPTGKIAAGQGFFAPTKAGGDVVFNNAMRISGGGVNGTNGGIGTNNAQFFKLSSGKTATTTVAKTEKNRIWLNLTNSEGAFKQTLVGYITGATNDYDGAFDGVTYNGNAFVDFYSVNNEVNLAIQGRALPFVKKDSVALGYRTTIIGDFQISIDQTDGVLSNQNVFLEDKDLKVLHDLKKEAYTFSTEKGTFNNRFVLRYVDKNAVDEVIPEVSDELNKAIVVALNKNEITIKTDIATIDKVFIYDSAGKKLYQKNKVDANVFVISHLISSHQVLVVDVVLSDGTKHSKKIIY